jgi:hypothetical protein
MAEHSTLTGSSLHEPKGAAGASSGDVYVFDGAGSGSATQLGGSNVAITDSGGFYSDSDVEAILQDLGTHYEYLQGVIADISTASFILLPLPENCTVVSFKTVLAGAIATSDAVVTLSRGGDAATLGTVTVANSGSAEGDVDENTSLSNTTVTTGTHKYLKVATDGASTNTVPVYVSVKVSISHGVY